MSFVLNKSWMRCDNRCEMSVEERFNLKNEEVNVSEWKFGLYGLIFAFFVIISKLFYAIRMYFNMLYV